MLLNRNGVLLLTAHRQNLEAEVWWKEVVYSKAKQFWKNGWLPLQSPFPLKHPKENPITLCQLRSRLCLEFILPSQCCPLGIQGAAAPSLRRLACPQPQTGSRHLSGGCMLMSHAVTPLLPLSASEARLLQDHVVSRACWSRNTLAPERASKEKVKGWVSAQPQF